MRETVVLGGGGDGAVFADVAVLCCRSLCFGLHCAVVCNDSLVLDVKVFVQTPEAVNYSAFLYRGLIQQRGQQRGITGRTAVDGAVMGLED